jgi:FAD dependent oxidoreductase
VTTAEYDVVVVGASLGGVAAALAAAHGGCTVCLVEPGSWAGGQMTVQGVCRPDDTGAVNTISGTRTYRTFRNRCRDYYKKNYKLSALGASAPVFNAGAPYMHGNAAAAHKLLQSTAVAEILSDAYLVDIGVGDSQIAEYQSYRDNLHRIIAQITRSSGITIAAQLIAATSDADALEVLALEAVRYLGFAVEEMRVTGKPEGVAVSPVSSSKVDPKRPYRFTIDAKSSQRAVVKTKDVHVSGLADHQKAHHADYTLIVAPDYEKGQLERLALINNITPVRACDLAKLLMLAATTGPIDLREFEGLFDQHDPSHAEQWISEFASRTLAEPRLSLDTILSALNEADFREGEPINVNVIVDRLKRNRSIPRVGSIDKHKVLAVFQGLSVLVPDLVRVEDNREYIYFGTSAAKLREAVQQQIERVPPAFRYGLDVPALQKHSGGATALSKSSIVKAKN